MSESWPLLLVILFKIWWSHCHFIFKIMAMSSSKVSRYKLSKNIFNSRWHFLPGHVKKLKGLLQTMVAFLKHLVDLIFYFGPLLDVLATKYDLIFYKMSLIFQLLNMAKFNKSGVFSFKMSSNFGGSTEYACLLYTSPSPRD